MKVDVQPKTYWNICIEISGPDMLDLLESITEACSFGSNPSQLFDLKDALVEAKARAARVKVPA